MDGLPLRVCEQTDSSTGTAIWATSTGGQLLRDIVISWDAAYAVGLRDFGDYAPVSYLQVLDLRTGRQLWRHESDVTDVAAWVCTDTDAFFAAAKELHRIHS